MKKVSLKHFETPILHTNVKDIVFNGEHIGKNFYLGFLPENEFVYHFEIAPDVFFRNLKINEVYYEPYRTFLRLSSPTDVQIYWKGKSGKLFVEGK
ncbi:MAG: hypothetical protein WBK20_08985 [Spirochaetota bacterium]